MIPLDRNEIEYIPKISVIVPVYNRESTIKECVDSLLGLCYPKEKLELIVVDNNSVDKTSSILADYGAEIHVVNERKRSPAAARNKGIDNATGEVVAFTDSDCVVEPEWLRSLVGPLQDSSIGIVGGSVRAKSPGNYIERFGERIFDQSLAIERHRPPYAITGNWASRTQLLRKHNFDEALLRGEDVDLAYRIFEAGYRLCYQPNAVVYHRNEHTLGGLFREGFQHGYYAVPLIKKHQAFVTSFGHKAFNVRGYTDLFLTAVKILRGQDRDNAVCSLVFNTGKKLGKISGSNRFGYVEL